MSEKNIINTFNRLIEDSNRRNFNLFQKNLNQKMEKEKTNMKVQNKEYKTNISRDKKNKNINNIKINKVKTKQRWDEIYEKRFNSKLKERNEKLEKMRKEKEEQKKKEEDLILDNLNKKQNFINQKYGLRKSKSVQDICKTKNNYNTNINNNNKIIMNLNQRLYYNEIHKKDLEYKTFMERAKEYLNDNNNSNNYFYMYGKNNEGANHNKKANLFRTSNIGAKEFGEDPKKKKMFKNNSVYNFKDFLDSNNEDKKDAEKLYDKFIKLMKENEQKKINDNKNNVNSNENTINQSNDVFEINNAEQIVNKFFEN